MSAASCGIEASIVLDPGVVSPEEEALHGWEGRGAEMDPIKRQILSTGRGRGGLVDSSKVFNELFFKSEAEKPSWMSAASEKCINGNGSDDEENLLDDACSSYMSRTFSIDSSGLLYSRTCSLESQDSYFNDNEAETEVVLRVAMCCGKCENKAKSLTQLEGVTSVVCLRKAEKVTVTGTARPRDILEACKKLFEQAKIWSPDDSLTDLNPAAPE